MFLSIVSPVLSKVVGLAIALGLISSGNLPVLALPRNLQETTLPEAPDTGTPEENSSPGGTRTDQLMKSKPLTSLLATDSRDFTVSEYPTFWFYIPYTREEIDSIDFVLEEPLEKQIIYRTTVELTEQPGIAAIVLPNQSSYALEREQDYRWELSITFTESSAKLPATIQGWIQRLPVTSQLQDQLEAAEQKYLVYMNNDLFYDAVTELAMLRRRYRESPEIGAAWLDLLDLLGWRELSEEPFIDLTLDSTNHNQLPTKINADQ